MVYVVTGWIKPKGYVLRKFSGKKSAMQYAKSKKWRRKPLVSNHKAKPLKVSNWKSFGKR